MVTFNLISNVSNARAHAKHVKIKLISVHLVIFQVLANTCMHLNVIVIAQMELRQITCKRNVSDVNQVALNVMRKINQVV
jgi:hypothetical protein